MVYTSLISGWLNLIVDDILVQSSVLFRVFHPKSTWNAVLCFVGHVGPGMLSMSTIYSGSISWFVCFFNVKLIDLGFPRKQIR